jgi:ABC-type transport system substrate-binding protein
MRVWSIVAIGVVSSILVFLAFGRQIMSRNENTVLKIGVPGTWGHLTPEQQHTAYAATIIQNQFEPLLFRGPNGTLEPHGAKNWTVSPDLKVFRFKIDTSKRFSDGTHLSAKAYKQAWEDGVRAETKSSHNVVTDILYKVEGFQDFKTTGHVSGIKALDDETLEVHFSKTFRAALEQFTVEYLGAYKIVNGEHIGTGPYVISQPDDNTARLRLNTFYVGKIQPQFKEVEFYALKSEECIESLRTGKIDVINFGERTDNGPIKNLSDIKTAAGQEVTHLVLVVNGLEGRTLHDSQVRRGLQSLVWKAIRENGVPDNLNGPHFVLDPQTILFAQAGRLEKREVENRFESDSKFISLLVEATKKRPLRFLTSEKIPWLMNLLKKYGVSFADNSGSVPVEKRIESYYKTFDSDLIVAGNSVMNGDPDGLYHFLGAKGAIASPISLRPKLSAILEGGRDILDQKEIDPYYKKVSEKILEEVPHVHLGYLTETIYYDSQKVSLNQELLARHNYSLLLYQPR